MVVIAEDLENAEEMIEILEEVEMIVEASSARVDLSLFKLLSPVEEWGHSGGGVEFLYRNI